MYSVVITAAGSGKRAKLGYNKMLYKINGLTLIETTVKTFVSNCNFNQIIITVSDSDYEQYSQILADYPVEITIGGSERMDSVAAGIKLATNDIVYVHDGARIFIDDYLINKLVSFEEQYDGLSLATQVTDTTLEVKNGVITRVLDRNTLFNMQTPQVVKKDIFTTAYTKAKAEQLQFTDEMSLLSNYGYKCSVVEGASYNMKLTKPEDFKEN